METININKFKEKLYFEKLDNGLEVYLIPMSDKKNYMGLLGVKYGGANTRFKIDDKEYCTPTGIAHFLEHKLFEQEVSPFNFYAKSGTDVNASTTQDYTAYYFMGNNNFNENLEFLLKWIKNFNITDAQVEKEKGIILEEASMYKDNPDRKIFELLNLNTFVNHPYRIKTIGTDSDIKRITKEDLELCYNTFYTPDNMALVVVGNFDLEETLKIIKENSDFKKKIEGKVTKVEVLEEDEVKVKKQVLKENINIPKIGISYKINKKNLNKLNIDKYELDLYIYLILALGFGNTSDFREELMKKELFTEAGYQLLDTKDYYVIQIICTTNYPEELYNKISNYILNVKLDEDSFERMKKTLIASEVRMIDNVSVTTYNVLYDILDYEKYQNEKIKINRSLKFEVLKDVYHAMSFKNEALVVLEPNGNIKN